MSPEEWIGIYKFGRLAALGLTLLGIGIYLYMRSDPNHFEGPALQMLEDDE